MFAATVVHALPGRVRFRLNPDSLQYFHTAEITRLVSQSAGIKSARVRPVSGSILVHYDAACLDLAALTALVRGIEPSPVPAQKKKDEGVTLWAYLAYQLFRLFCPPQLKPAFTLLGAVPFFIEGVRSFTKLRMDVALLDASAITLSVVRGNFSSASTLIMLLKTGQYLEDWAKFRSRENLAARISLDAGQVWVRKDGEEVEIPYSALKTGDLVVLRAGFMIPVDGKVAEGNALVNEASMTGESLGASRTAGDTVHAGTVIEEGELVVEVARTGADTRFQKIVQLIRQSEESKAATELKANELANRLVPFTFLTAALAALITRNLQKVQSVLSVDYSCAIKLSTPLVFLAAMREGLSNGVFFKGGAPMETLAAVDTMVFDKTGTLTCAAPSVDRIISYHQCSEREALKIAACLEEHFPHPVAKAVVRHALNMNVQHREEHSEVKYIAAHGIATDYRGKHTLIGSRHFIKEDEGIDVSAAEGDLEAIAGEGKSALYLARDGKLIAIFAIDDPPRPEAPEVIAMLRALGVKEIYMLSGDNRRTAARVAKKLTIAYFRGELLPNEKTETVRLLRAEGRTVAMVGDGMNDSPAMSAANIGIAMKEGADLAQDVADITMRDPSLYPLVVARLLSQKAIKRIHHNTAAAIGINSALILAGLLGTQASGSFVWLHNLTTLGLSLNSMRPLLPKNGG
ncbi:MAG: heavy metal translocating P-type ATPase [Spirochaetaceae bacterium]|jgi:Cu2+-exporting ATPase|nr:heavy metal translocating P-type ATPase [Spirochaetaceae bacterium]